MGGVQSTPQIVNFAAGPAKIPEEVIDSIREDVVNYKGTGIGILSTSHRSKEVQEIVTNAKDRLRRILNIPENYEILFKQAGGQGQFAAVPLNIIGKTGKADYAVTGSWSDKAVAEAGKYGDIHRVYAKPKQFTSIPAIDSWDRRSDASYLYYCSNETIHGVEYNEIPETHPDVPLVCDASSHFLTRPLDVSKHGIVFAAAQKNIGPAGITVVIVRKDLLGNADPHTPSVLCYTTQTKHDSIFNTPPVFSLYVTGKVMEWLEANGGVEEMERRSIAKSKRIYDIIDNSNGFYTNNVDPSCRSRVNIPFTIKGGNEELEKIFLEESFKRGMRNLKGHRSVGGMRASLYNAITLEETEVLAKFMEAFMEEAKTKGH